MLLLLLACAGDDDLIPRQVAGECGPTTCDGCCDADGTCTSGSVSDACGRGGGACRSCDAVGQSCQERLCTGDAWLESEFVDDASLHILDAADAVALRHALSDAIFDEDGGVPGLLPEIAETSEVPWDLSGVASVQTWTVDLGDGWVSQGTLLVPETPTGRLMIYHQGHSDIMTGNGGDNAMQYFLDQGDTVLALYMPLYGDYDGPYDNHDTWLLETSDPLGELRTFLLPVAAGVNQGLLDGATQVGMIGISGGGWTTTLYAALDTRVALSFPVAGSLPLYLRDDDIGDSEQYLEVLYQRAGFLDLYALSALGDRRALQVLNRYDLCCFDGLRYQDYEATVADAVAGWGGEFGVFLDESHEDHQISKHALEAAIGHVWDGDGVETVDDLDPSYGAFQATGTWTTALGEGFDSEHLVSSDATSAATWTFELPAGDYRVSATWVDAADRPTDARYWINGDREVRVDQTQAPSDRAEDGASWADLEPSYAFAGGTLSVTLEGAGSADAVRVQSSP